MRNVNILNTRTRAYIIHKHVNFSMHLYSRTNNLAVRAFHLVIYLSIFFFFAALQIFIYFISRLKFHAGNQTNY